MEIANKTNFFAAHDNLKKYPCKINNIFMDSQELSRKFATQVCHFHKADKSVFLLLPFHGDIQVMHFFSADPQAFATDLHLFMSCGRHPDVIKTSLIGKEANYAISFHIWKAMTLLLLKNLSVLNVM